MTAIKPPETLAQETFNSGIGTRAVAIPKLTRALIVQVIVLNNPTRSESPHTSENIARTNAGSFSS